MRKSAISFVFLGGLGSLLLVSAMDSHLRNRLAAPRIELMRHQVALFELTDLSLFTEARYSRHLTQADLHTPFQDHPMALEHFPSGSLVAPPRILRTGR